MIAPPIRFSLEPRPPFRLDLTVWALRRRPANIVDRWDGVTYRRTMRLGGRVAEITACQFGPPEEARLDIAVTTAGATDPRQVQAQVSATLDRILGLDVDLGDFYERTRGDAHLGPLCRQHHNAKTHKRWTLTYQPSTGTRVWTSPLGKTYLKTGIPRLM